MKILLVATKAEIGGVQTFILTLAKGLKKSGIQVVVATGAGDFLPEELKKNNIDFFILKNLKRNLNPFSALLFIKEIKRLIDKENFDVVHFNSTNTLLGVCAVRFSKHKPKTIFTIHGLSIVDTRYKASIFLKNIFKKYFELLLRYIEVIVFVSRSNMSEAINRKIVRHGKVIYNGLEIDKDYFLTKLEARNELEGRIDKNLSGAYLIGSIGRLVHPKHYDFIIKNFSEIKKIKPSAKLIIIGEGPEKEKYEKIIRRLGFSDEIFLLGEIKDAGRFLKSFDLFVLSSIYEGLSISLIEALFSDIPILASDVGGNKEVVGLENCYKFDNKEDFIKKLRGDLFSQVDKSLFSAEVMVKEYIKIYEI